MAVVFVQFTYLQFNDLKQYETRWWQGWVVTYGFCAVVSLAGFWKALPRWFYLTACVVALVCAAYWSLGIEWEKTILHNKNNPSGNETGGLLVIAIWMGVLTWKHSSLGRPAMK